MTEGIPGFVQAPGWLAVGVGGHLIRSTDGDFRVLRFLNPSGEILNVALADDTVTEGVRTTAQDLQLATIEADTVFHDIGMYEPR
ncbi:hypothetical protein [Mycobacterium sp. 236(2023)]|uniref:hypothetical protein n=1 Tax=Mycobacterium sp. 236(2023) TaxID=3038163 RepID=UPI002415420F|nr:hypothetical protein [Mycobacterium sp. 236(2023)]MDG4669465.1 hypothetical protein [Mycobacterium sp. 236(2023)]